ncbi:response regulator [Galbibacter pacificus]|uniref:Response regulator transcription factor n=1 Tax=Galbibacter pacificus TaxID=2996052 RepID=A0ABT6FQN2_9FLAO|nr:response regulator transcription factor [Galbibacter pacificus]MDG3582155.1 response regulator transcription factor [Galbibacter pacificus]MDG3585369.1 response regulator transcription factor [Galbibacter pacificus]
MKKYSIAVVDDHSLFAKSLTSLIDSFNEYHVTLHATNGQKFIEALNENDMPDIVLLDINMPIMNGIETMEWLKENHPAQKAIALSMDDSEETIIKMLRLGAKGYLLKDIHPEIFENALNDVIEKGFYYSDRITNKLLDTIDKKQNDDHGIQLKDREIEFLKLACTEMTYKEIAAEMFLSPKTIDGYRESLFEKLDVRSRIGLVLYGIKNKYIEM